MPKRPVPTLTLTLEEARRLALHAQGFGPELSPFGEGGEGAFRAINHLGYVQIDTISVIERAHHHVLWSRVPDYHPRHLDELQAGPDRRVFEYWSHAAAYLPIQDYRFCLPRMRALASGRRKHWFERDRKTMRLVLDRIRAEGPLQAKDFEAPEGQRSGPWFDWKPAKRALEQLFMEGALMIRGRQGFQKIYDLAERVLPPGVDTRMPTPIEHARFLAERALRSHGLAREAEMRYLRKGCEEPMAKAVRGLLAEGRILPVQVEGLSGPPFYALAASFAESREAAARGWPEPARDPVRILSPFDNTVIQRRRLRDLFGFDYQIECYVPEPKRKFGYFCLPLLRGDRMLGRIDAKAERESGVLRVRALWIEDAAVLRAPPRAREELGEALRSSLAGFAAFNGCGSYLVERTAPAAAARALGLSSRPSPALGRARAASIGPNACR